MYVKTQWVNNTTPINDTNLNKIEQGIYDNSLVTEAITNTLNPTDTETYKTAELTEGQITDVIGVNDIIIKGQTSQDGTPTPSAPVDVNVVSGSNVINTSNKNLLSLPNGTYSYNNVTAIVNKGIITINGTPSSTPTLLQISLSQPIKLKQNDSVKINVNNSNGIGTSSNYVAFRLVGIVNGASNDNITEVMCTSANANKTFTATNNTIINQVVIRGNTNVTFNNFIIKPQIELGTTTTTYEQHQGKELPLDLPVENLFDGTFNQGGVDFGGTGQSTTSTNRINTNFISVKPNTTYIISNFNSNIYQFGIGLYKNDQTYDSNHKINNGGWNNFPYTFTTQSDTYYIRMAFKNSNDTTLSPTGDYKIMLSKGSSDNAYTPYGTDPIELCKIGDYQDYFYKTGSKWYLHKEIGKIILNGTQTIKYFNAESTNTSRVYFENIINAKNNNIDVYANQLSGKFIWDTDENGIYVNSTIVAFRMSKSIIGTTIEEVNTYLSNNNIILYYILNTATNTEITGTLKEQLEAIYNAPLYEQTNITQTNNDLPMVLDITACKDNINGIKAFIRK